jgi:anti-sigma regulatory factor (Ser/Thr protein kinase)
MQIFKLEMDYPEMSRDEFRGVFKRNLGNQLGHLPYDWTSNLITALGEIVKNFYDHADKKGVILITVDTHEMTFEAYDFGPGASDKAWAPVSKENCGRGLEMIRSALNGLKLIRGVRSCDIEIILSDRFHYKGKITY